MSRFLLFLAILFASSAFAQAPYNLILDYPLSSKALSEDLVTAHKLTYTVENKYLKPKLFDESNTFRKLSGMAYRFGKTVFVDIPIDHIILLVQHEVYGHGYRYREMGFVNNHYQIKLPPPYDCGGGMAYRGEWKGEGVRNPTRHEEIIVSVGGMEANTILANTMISKWMAKGSMNYRETYLYVSNRNNITAYIQSTALCEQDDDCEPSRGNDVLSYLKHVNAENGFLFEKNYRLSLDDLKKQSLINLLDPFQFFALYTYFKTYLWDGGEENKFPMIPLWKVRYLPSFHLGLSPFGPEYYFDNYISTDNKWYSFYFRKGDNTFHDFWGLGINGNQIIDNRYLTFNPSLDLWQQPPIKTGGTEINEIGGGLGFAASGTFLFKVVKGENPFSIYTQLGYKTAGFLPGEMIADGLILRLGLSFGN